MRPDLVVVLAPALDHDLRLGPRPEPLQAQALGIMEQAHHPDGWSDDPFVASMWLMEDDLIVKALRNKRAEIHGRITAYEAQIEQAKHDLAHVNATLRLFTDVEKQRARYVVSHGFFRKGEIADLCALQLQDGSELTTRALAERVMRARDLDASDTTLRNSVVFKVVQALRHAARRKLVVLVDKRKGMCIWAAGPAITLRVANSPSRGG